MNTMEAWLLWAAVMCVLIVAGFNARSIREHTQAISELQAYARLQTLDTSNCKLVGNHQGTDNNAILVLDCPEPIMVKGIAPWAEERR